MHDVIREACILSLSHSDHAKSELDLCQVYCSYCQASPSIQHLFHQRMSTHVTALYKLLVVNVLQHLPCFGTTQRPRPATVPEPAKRYGIIRMHASKVY